MNYKPRAIETEFKGKPMIEFQADPGDPQTFGFGVFRAKVILACLPDLRAFVEKHDRQRGQAQRPAYTPPTQGPKPEIGFGDPAPTAAPEPQPTQAPAPETANERRPVYKRPEPTYNR